MSDPNGPSNASPSCSVLEQATLLDHDIRNALAEALSGLQTLETKSLDDAQSLAVEKARLSVQQLAHLSYEALSLATGEAAIVEDANAAMNTQAFLKGLYARFATGPSELRLQTDETLPDLLHLSPNLLERILGNLLSNAFKYGAGQLVQLRVTVTPRSDLIFAVQDDGPGFSDSAKARLFAFSGRGDTESQPGTGHGMHIANTLARDLGGHLSLDSPEGGGATVSLHLPRSAWSVDHETRKGPSIDLSGKTVLIADDSQTLQMAMQRMVETLGASTQIASNGVEALKLMEKTPCDLALIDIEMPKMCGLKLIRQLRSDPATKELPILAVTAYARNNTHSDIYDADADGILVKPVLSLSTLADAIQTVVEKREGLATGPLPADEGLDLTHIDRLLAFGTAEQGRDLMMRLIADLENVALCLENAPNHKDYAEIRSAAHILIALSGAVGAARLQKLAERLNSAANANDCHTGGPLCRAALEGTLQLIQELRSETHQRYGTGL